MDMKKNTAIRIGNTMKPFLRNFFLLKYI